MRIFDPLGGLRPPELVGINSAGASQNTNQIQLRFRRASNIDFCRTSHAIVKVLGGQGDNFGTNLGPKRHPPERWNGLGRPLVPDLGHKFCRRASNIDFCRTSPAIVKVLGGQGDHFGTILGPILDQRWHRVGTRFGRFGTREPPAHRTGLQQMSKTGGC